MALRVLTRGVAESTDVQLDERDRALRDRAFQCAYVVAACGVAAVAFFVVLAAQQPELTERVIKVRAVLAVGMIVAPTAALARALPQQRPRGSALTSTMGNLSSPERNLLARRRPRRVGA